MKSVQSGPGTEEPACVAFPRCALGVCTANTTALSFLFNEGDCSFPHVVSGENQSSETK